MSLFLLTLPADIREFFIVMDAILIFLCFELAMLFFVRTKRMEMARKINLGWGLEFIFFGLIHIFNFSSDYYVSDQPETIVILFTAIPTIGVVLIFEYLFRRYRNTHYLFSLSGIIVIAFYLLFSSSQILLFTIAIYYLVLFGYLIAVFRKLIKLSTGNIRKSIIGFMLAFFLLFFGNMLSSPNTVDNMITMGIDTVPILFFAKILKIICYYVMFSVLISLPIFLEVDWKEKLFNLYVIHKNMGITLNQTQFQVLKKQDGNIANRPSDDLIGGGMIGIATMLKEISQSTQNLSLINHGDQLIMLEYGKDFIIALIVSEELRIFREKVISLRKKIETYYPKSIENWDGDMGFFEPLKYIIENEFKV